MYKLYIKEQVIYGVAFKRIELRDLYEKNIVNYDNSYVISNACIC